MKMDRLVVGRYSRRHIFSKHGDHQPGARIFGVSHQQQSIAIRVWRRVPGPLDRTQVVFGDAGCDRQMSKRSVVAIRTAGQQNHAPCAVGASENIGDIAHVVAA